MGAADRVSVAFSARRIPFAGHLLAKAEAVGRAGCVARRLASSARSPRRRGLVAVGGDVPGRQLRSSEKGGSAVGEPSGARERSGWYWSTAAVFHWEFGLKVPLREKLRLRKPRSPKSKSPAQRPSETEAEARDRRPRIRLRPTARTTVEARHRPHRVYRLNNKLRKHEDGRKLRRYKRRWIVERTNAWLGQFRRLLVRHEHLLTTYKAFFHLACLWITLYELDQPCSCRVIAVIAPG